VQSSGDSGVADAAPSKQRSRVTNGSILLVAVDARSATYRRYKDILLRLTADAFPHGPSEAQQQLVRRAASLSVWCGAQEAALANGEEIDIDTLQRVSNTLRRLLESIGLKRQAVDRTPSLSEYLARRDAAKAAATKEATHE